MSHRGEALRLQIAGPQVDLEREDVRDSRGRRVDRAYVDQALAEAEHELAQRFGRPSLTGRSEHSPHIAFRVTPEVKAQAARAAREQGVSVSQLARAALERYLAS